MLIPQLACPAHYQHPGIEQARVQLGLDGRRSENISCYLHSLTVALAREL
jgi:hypothetical protein